MHSAWKLQDASMMVLFLDFDGVLHPQYEGLPTPAEEVFCHLSRFEAVMRDFPAVQIVVSSSWRFTHTLDQMRTHFSPDIAARIIGTTPQLDTDAYLPTRREQEILSWLGATGNEDVPWIALDDASWQFQLCRDRLVACTWYTGLDDAAADKLRIALGKIFA